MNKIDYLIVAFFAVVVLVALYIRFTYQPPINILVKISNYNGTVFPFEMISIPINVTNLGSSNIQNLGFEVLVNGNISRMYSLTIPSGKEAFLFFNFTPDSSGSYNITAIADPAKLYAITDRSKATSTVSIYVEPQEALRPYAPITKNGLVYVKEANLTNTGALLAIYFNKNYSVPLLEFADLNVPQPFIGSLVELMYKYLADIGIAYANYTNGSSIYSLWLRGYVNKLAIDSALNAINANYTYVKINGENVTFANLGENTTFCSWYSEGWIKNIAYKGGSCLKLIGLNYSNPIPNSSIYGEMDSFSPNYTVTLGSYKMYYFPSNSPATAKILSYTNAVVVPTISESPGSIVCYGIISNASNESFCSTYLFPATQKIGKYGLVRTTAYIPPYNYSLFSLVNQSGIVQAVPVNVRLLQSLGAKGPSLQFISGFSNACNIENFSCGNVRFANGQIYLTLGNLGNESVRISGINCFVGKGKITPANVIIPSKGEANLTATCYQNGTVIGGVPLGLKVSLNVSYSVNNESRSALGNAIINFFG